jgi:hypothetical protein
LLLQAAQSNKSLYFDLLSVAHLAAPDSKIFTNKAVVPGLLREYNVVEKVNHSKWSGIAWSQTVRLQVAL